METNKKIWENQYKAGKQIMSYPYGELPSYIFKKYGKHTNKSTLKVLEVGSGTGNNLWFFAREGFQTYGIEISKTGVQTAKILLKDEALKAKIICGSFTNLSEFEDNFFDLVLDRHALYSVSSADFSRALDEIYRVLKKGGHFLSFMYSDESECIRYGKKIEDNTYNNFTKGPFVHSGMAHFVNKKELLQKIYKGYDVEYVKKITYDDVYPKKENEIAVFVTMGKKK